MLEIQKRITRSHVGQGLRGMSPMSSGGKQFTPRDGAPEDSAKTDTGTGVMGTYRTVLRNSQVLVLLFSVCMGPLLPGIC